MPDLLTIAEAARFLRVSRRTMYRKLNAGEIPFRRVLGRVRFAPDELERWTRRVSFAPETNQGGIQ